MGSEKRERCSPERHEAWRSCASCLAWRNSDSAMSNWRASSSLVTCGGLLDHAPCEGVRPPESATVANEELVRSWVLKARNSRR